MKHVVKFGRYKGNSYSDFLKKSPPHYHKWITQRADKDANPQFVHLSKWITMKYTCMHMHKLKLKYGALTKTSFHFHEMADCMWIICEHLSLCDILALAATCRSSRRFMLSTCTIWHSTLCKAAFSTNDHPRYELARAPSFDYFTGFKWTCIRETPCHGNYTVIDQISRITNIPWILFICCSKKEDVCELVEHATDIAWMQNFLMSIQQIIKRQAIVNKLFLRQKLMSVSTIIRSHYSMPCDDLKAQFSTVARRLEHHVNS